MDGVVVRRVRGLWSEQQEVVRWVVWLSGGGEGLWHVGIGGECGILRDGEEVSQGKELWYV